MHYIGKLESDGSVFDQSASKAPFQFKIGMAHVIRGWDEGIMKMSLGEKATLTITADFGYGARGLSLAPLARALEVLVVPVLVVSWDRGALASLAVIFVSPRASSHRLPRPNTHCHLPCAHAHSYTGSLRSETPSQGRFGQGLGVHSTVTAHPNGYCTGGLTARVNWIGVQLGPARVTAQSQQGRSKVIARSQHSRSMLTLAIPALPVGTVFAASPWIRRCRRCHTAQRYAHIRR